MGKKILHIIDSFKPGGAEKLLLGYLDRLTDYENILVILSPDYELNYKLKTNITCINYRSKLDLIGSVSQLKKLIRKESVDLIHSHLPTSTFLARLAKPKNVKLVFSVHNLLSKSAFKVSKLSWFLEKLFHKKSETALFVSNSVQLDYEKSIGKNSNSYVLYNYIEYDFVSKKIEISNNNSIKLISVGSLKEQKNHKFLIEAIADWSHEFILDIYGEGNLREELEKLIDDLNLNKKVRLKGHSGHLSRILLNYDCFILASKYEGFGLAPLEAMAVGLPTLLSNIEVFKEVAKEGAVYFNLNEADDLQKKLNMIADHSYREKMSIKGRERLKRIANKNKYIEKLCKIYETD